MALSKYLCLHAYPTRGRLRVGCKVVGKENIGMAFPKCLCLNVYHLIEGPKNKGHKI